MEIIAETEGLSTDLEFGSWSKYLVKLEFAWLVGRPIAHRGLHSGDHRYPENSLTAFERAKEKGFCIELDVNLLADGQVIVFHDENTLRMTDVEGGIHELDAPHATSMRLLGSDQRIPLLHEVLELVNGGVPLLIEIKNLGVAGKLERALASSLSDYKGPFAIQSFNPFSLRWFKVNAGHLCRGQIAGDFRDIRLPSLVKLPLRMLWFNRVSSPTFINYDIRCLPNRTIEKERRKGLPILGWTATTLEEYQHALEWCDSVIFEGFDPEDVSR